jgi:hypothetical protein
MSKFITCYSDESSDLIEWQYIELAFGNRIKASKIHKAYINMKTLHYKHKINKYKSWHLSPYIWNVFKNSHYAQIFKNM